MIFEQFNGAVFVPEGWDHRNLRSLCASLSAHLEGKSSINIFLTHPAKLLIALLAALRANADVVVLSELSAASSQAFLIDEAVFDSLSAIGAGDEVSASDELLHCSEEFFNAEFFIQTSGSSGKSKPVAKTLNQILIEAKYLKEHFHIQRGDLFISSVHAHHFFGLIYKLFLPLVAGAKIHTELLLLEGDILQIEQKFHFIASPVVLKNLLKTGQNFHNFKSIFSAGSPLSKELRAALNAQCVGAKIINIYGSSETGSIAADEGDGLKLLPAVKGELKNNLLFIKSLWAEFLSKDIARLNGDSIELLGRADRMIKHNDRRINLQALEEKLCSSALLDEAHVFEHKGVLVALIRLSEQGIKRFISGGKTALVSELRAMIFEDFKNSIKSFKIFNKSLMNNQSKISYARLVEEFNTHHMPVLQEVSRKGSSAVFSADIGCELAVFEQHFPRLPIFAGYAQLQLVAEAARKMQLGELSGFKSLKFNTILRPNHRINIKISAANSLLSAEITDAENGVSYLKAKASTSAFKPYKLGFLVPHFNHSEKLFSLVSQLAKFGEVIVVDDGSSSDAMAVLRQCEQHAKVIYCPQNRGKGAAMKTGARYMLEQGFTHAFQIDADMQHELAVCAEFIAHSRACCDALICGAPEYFNAPKSRYYGRKITNFWLRLSAIWLSAKRGQIEIKDGMCGFRIYPIAAAREAFFAPKSERMGYDIEALYTHARANVALVWRKVCTNYPPDGLSHFRAIADNIAISAVHARYFFTALKDLALKPFAPKNPAAQKEGQNG